MKSIKCAALCGALLFSATPVRAWFFDTVANWVSPKVALVTASVAAVAVWYLWPKKKKDKKHKIREKEIVANLTPPQLQQSQNNDEVDEHERALPLNQQKSVTFTNGSQRVIPRTTQQNVVPGVTSLLNMRIPTGADAETKSSDESDKELFVPLGPAAPTMSGSASMEDPNHVTKITALNDLPRTQLAQEERFDLQQEKHVNGVTIPNGIFQIIFLVEEKVNAHSKSTSNKVKKVKAKTYTLVHEKAGQQFVVKFEKTVEDKKLSRHFAVTEIKEEPRTVCFAMHQNK